MALLNLFNSDYAYLKLAQLQTNINTLQKERGDALSLAATRQAEADTWKTRYEELKPQLAKSAATSSQILGTIKQELAQFIAQPPLCPHVEGEPDRENPAVGDMTRVHWEVIY